jgi:tRNA pseudouridine55 synthase
VSAVKVAGRRAYERVRAGERVELAPRRVTIHELTLHDPGTAGPVRDLRVTVRCSSGTYIRAIARDLGTALGVGGHLTALRRTAVGPFTLDRAHTLDALAERYLALPIAEAARLAFATRDLSPDEADAVRVGRPLAVELDTVAPVAVFAPDGEFLALYAQRGPLARPVAVFVG